MAFQLSVLLLLLDCVVGQEQVNPNISPWSISSSSYYNENLDQTFFSYEVQTQANGQVVGFQAGIPSCPEIHIVGSPARSNKYGVGGINFQQDIGRHKTWTYSVVVQGMVDSGEISYAVPGLKWTRGASSHIYSTGTILGPKCTKVPKITCDPGQTHYHGECVGNTVRVALVSHSKYYTKLQWSTDYPGCSFSQVDTVSPYINFHGPICDTEFRVKLEVWGDNHQHETCYTTITATDTTPPTFGGLYGASDMEVQCDDIPAPLHVVAKDSCDNDVEVVFSEIEEISGYDYTIRRKWVAIDACDNKATHTQKIVVRDSEKPVFIGIPEDETVHCNVEVNPCVVVAIDNCDDVSVDHTEKVIEGTCVDEWKIIRTWIAEDESHNSVTKHQTVSVLDNVDPVIIGVPEDITVDCSEVPENVVATATDNCQETVFVETSERIVPGTCVHNYHVIRSFSAVDDCGNHVSKTWKVTVIDVESPRLSELADSTDHVECDNVGAPCIVEAVDNCHVYDIPITPEVSKLNVDCTGNYTIRYIWTATDECGNEASATKNIVVFDDEPPTFTIKVPTQLKASCRHFDAPTMRAVDNCGSAEVITMPEEREQTLSTYGALCPLQNYNIYRRWVATDECGLTAIATQTVTVTDVVPPVLIGVPPDMTLACDSDYDFSKVQVQAIDNCDCVESPHFMQAKKYAIVCPDTFTIVNKWWVYDCCGHDAEHFQTVHVYDDEPPRFIGIPGSKYLSIEDMLDLPFPVVTAEDNCDELILVDDDQHTVPGTCEHNYVLIRSWYAVDDCGNEQRSYQTIRCNDLTPPSFINLNYATDFECPIPVILPSIEVTDNVGGYLVNIDEDRQTIKGTCEDSYSVLRYVTATDPCGNTAKATYTVYVYDTTPPEWVNVPCQEEQYRIVDTKEAYNGLCVDDIKARDICAGNVVVDFKEETITTSCSNEYMIAKKWVATDNCGNSVQVVRTVDVRDQTPPELINVPDDVFIDCTDDYTVTYTSPTAYDYGIDYELEVTLRIGILSGQPCEFNFTAFKCWTVHDCVGHSVSACQTIEVRDNRVPTFTYLPVDETVPCEAIPEPITVTAHAECGAAVVGMTESRQAGTCPHNYLIFRTYVAQDECDVSATHTQTITVVDEEAPTYDFIPLDEVLECGSYSRYVAASCVDNCDYKLDIKRSKKVGESTCEDEKVDIRIWHCNDDCGNVATASQTIQYKDTQPPRFNFQPMDLSLPCSGKVDVRPPVPNGIQANDNCDRDVKVKFLEKLKEGAYGRISSENYRVWTAADNCGNVAEHTQTIIVFDDVPPVVDIMASYTRHCTDELSIPDHLSVFDNCDLEPQVQRESRTWYKECHNRYQMEFCWTPYDKVGNYGQQKCMRITVDDSTPPEWVELPASYKKVSYTEPVVPHGLEAIDNCDEKIHVTWTEDITKLPCPLEQRIVYTYVAEDVCGNAITFVQTILVVDDVPPPLAPKPDDITIPCPTGIPEPPTVLSSDAYAYEEYEVEFFESDDVVTCEQERTVIRRWMVRDCAFNVNSWIQTISVVDDLPPTLPKIDDRTYECEPEDYVIVEASDECDLYVDVSFENTKFDVTDCAYKVAREWIATDDCGNKATETQTLFIEDKSKPMLYGAPTNQTVDNHNVPGYYNLTCSDNCYVDDYIADFTERTVPGTCDHEWDIYRRWTCTDDCASSDSHIQLIKVRDNEVPVFAYCPKDFTVQLGQVPDPVKLTATDGQVYGEVEVTFDEQKELHYQPTQLFVLFRVWSAEDHCGNVAECRQTVSVIDTIPPIIPDVPRDQHLDCDDDLFKNGLNWDSAYAAISELLQKSIADVGTVEITPGKNGPFPMEKIMGTCKTEYTVKRTWTATDKVGNSLSDTQVITVFDDRPPNWNTIVDPNIISAECEHSEMDDITATDDCEESSYMFVNQNEKKQKGSCPNQYVVYREWQVQDSCGNSATQTQTVYVTDPEAPNIDEVPRDIELNCTSYTSLPISEPIYCTDNCVDGQYAAVYTESKHQHSCLDSWLFIRKWSCSDSCGHEVHRRQTITLVDYTPPFFVDEEYASIEVECEGEPPVPIEPVIAQDDCAKYVDVHYETAGYTVGYTIARYEQLWTASDNCGNQERKKRTVNVVDLTDPVIDPKPDSVTVKCHDWSGYQMPEPHCSDNCGAATLQRDVHTVPGTCEQEYDIVVDWVCTDQHNRIDDHSMTITVVDNEPPTLNVHDQSITVPCDAINPEPPVAVSDNCDYNVDVSFKEETIYPGYVLDAVGSPFDFTYVEPSPFGEYFPTYYPIGVSNIEPTKVKLAPSGSGLAYCQSACMFETSFDCAAVQFVQKYGERCYMYDFHASCEVQKHAYFTPDESNPAILTHERAAALPDQLWMFTRSAVFSSGGDILCKVEHIPPHLCDNYELVRHWHASDECGNFVNKYHRIKVTDENPPVLSKIPGDRTIDCADEHYVAVVDDRNFESARHGIRAPTAYDDCDPLVSVKEVVDHRPGVCQSNSVTIYKWTATDDCGLIATGSMTMTKKDDTPPQLSYVPEDEDIECVKPLPAPANVTATDDCNNVTVTLTKEQKQGTCNYLLVYTWVGTDECGNTASHQQILHVSDTLPPIFKDVPQDSTTDCADSYVLSHAHDHEDSSDHDCDGSLESCKHGVVAPTAEDECGPSAVHEKLEIVHLTCENDVMYVFVWTASDECGNKIDTVMTLTKLDTAPPMITGVPDDETDECDTLWKNPGIESTDDCGPSVIKFSEVIEKSDCKYTNILYTVFRTWVATDLCGHQTFEYQTVVVVDVNDPTINVPEDTTVGCKDDIPTYQAIADDDCGIDPSYLTSETFTELGTCEDNYDVITRYTAVDRCGNTHSVDHTVQVLDTEPPVLTGKPVSVTVPCDEIPDVASVQVQDDCVYPSPHFDETTTREGYCGSPYDIVRCWWVADNCGHRVDYCHTITVEDNKPPVLECAGASKCQNVEIECEVYPPLPPVTAKDNCYEHLEIDYTVHTEDGTCEHDHKEYRMWTTNDCAGGYATLTQTVTYYDRTAPVLEGYVDDTTVECPNEVAIPTVVANDNCDYVLTTDFSVTVDDTYQHLGCSGTHVMVRVWTATDLCGNVDYLRQTVTVVDTVAPVINVYAAHVKVECDKVITAWPGQVTAEDECDGSIDVKFLENKEDGTCEDSYTLIRKWVAEDCHGNSNIHVQTVTVADTIPPYFINSPPPDITLSQEDVYTGITELEDPFLITADDNCANPSVKFEEVSIPISYECDYMYYRIRTWSIHDDCGNKDQVQQTIEMVRTAEPELDQPEDLTVECDSVPPPCDVQLVGEFNYAVTINFKEETVHGSCEFEYTLRRTWTANDCGYNTGEVFQLVTVQDNTAPVFTRYPDDATYECGCDSLDAVVEIDAVDNCDLGGDEVNYDIETFPDTCKESYTIYRKWEAVDSCGNTAFFQQEIRIVDTEPPLFCDDFCDEDYTDVYASVECDRFPSVEDPFVKDDCDDTPELQKLQLGEDISESSVCDSDKRLVYSWRASDDCGNENTCSRTIEVRDTTPPTMVGAEHYCFPVNDYGPTKYGSYAEFKQLSIELLDNCDQNGVTQTIISCNGTQHDNHGADFDETHCVYFPQLDQLYVLMDANLIDYVGRYYYIWFRVTDACGNEAVLKRTIWVPSDSFSYQDAVSRGNCPYGLGSHDLVPSLPRRQKQF